MNVVCCRLFVCIAKRHSGSRSIIHQSRICLFLCQHFSLGDHRMFSELFFKCSFYIIMVCIKYAMLCYVWCQIYCCLMCECQCIKVMQSAKKYAWLLQKLVVAVCKLLTFWSVIEHIMMLWIEHIMMLWMLLLLLLWILFQWSVVYK